MLRITCLLALLAIFGLLVVLVILTRRAKPGFVEAAPSALLLWKLGKWHHRKREDQQALTAYYWAKQAQVKADAVWSTLTPKLLYDIGDAMDSESSSFALAQKLAVYEELARTLEQTSWEEHLGELTDQTEVIRDIGMAALSLKEVELEIHSWQVSLRLCLATKCAKTIRNAEILLRVGVSMSKRPGQDMDKVLLIYEEAEQIFEALDQRKHQLYAILVHNFGATHGQRGDRKGEWKAFEKALQLYRNTTQNYTETYTSLLYEVSMAREELGDADGGIAAFQEAETAFLHNPSIGERLRTTHVIAIGEMRKNVGNVAGALHAFEVADEVQGRLGNVDADEVKQIKKNLKEIRTAVDALPTKKKWVIWRDLELHRRPNLLASKKELEEGAYLQSAGR